MRNAANAIPPGYLRLARCFAEWKHPLIVTLITLFFALAAMAVYLRGPLNGEFNHFFLPGQMFGMPSALKAHGLTEMYTGKDETGWDGQFYYYIANDPFARSDTPHYVDADAYRYQRVGLPLLAKIASKLLMRAWVSPFLYYATSLAIIFAATGLGAWYFARRGTNPYWLLCWSLAFGTQVTQLNGLPDAAADGLLIISLIGLLLRLPWLYCICMVFAVLSREIYLLVPACFGLAALWVHGSEYGWRGLRFDPLVRLVRRIVMHAIPICVAIGWQVFLWLKFGKNAPSQAAGIFDWPLRQSMHYLVSGFMHHHPLVGGGMQATAEGVGIAFFLLLMAFSARVFYAMFAPTATGEPLAPEHRLGFALSGCMLVAIYLCFGTTVMMHHTGYLKAINVFLFLLPLAYLLQGRPLPRMERGFLCIFVVLSFLLLWNRISAPPYYPQRVIHNAPSQPACLTDYRAIVKPAAYAFNTIDSRRLKRLFAERTMTMDLAVTNKTRAIFAPYNGAGAVNISYRWIDMHSHAVVLEGARAMLENSLAPGDSATVPLVIHFPWVAGDYLLRLSPVQEGCSWFYEKNPSSAFDMNFTIR